MTSRDRAVLSPDEDAGDPTLELESDDPTLDFELEKQPSANPSANLESPLPTSAGTAASVEIQPVPAAPPPPLSVGPGTKLRERYLLQQVIGSGGTSMVYRAQDLRHEASESSTRVIAVKLLREELREDSRSIERLKREFTQMQLLAHPGVLKVFDVDVDRGVWFMTMEMLEGQSLGMYLRTHRAPHPQALDIVKSCAEALQFAHDRGIVHGDLKPGNIFLTSGGVRVLDFIGAADDLRTDRAATPTYASPQRLAGELPTASDDVYSLGCVAYELLAGVHPFDRKPATVAHELGLQPARINSLSYREWRALDRALAFDPLDRHVSMRAFLDALFLEQPKHAAVPRAHGGHQGIPTNTDGANGQRAENVGIEQVVVPAAVLATSPAGAGEMILPVTPSPPGDGELRLRDQEVLLAPIADAEPEIAGRLPPLFEPPPRNSVALPVIVASVLAVLALYLTSSDVDLDTSAPATPPAALTSAAAAESTAVPAAAETQTLPAAAASPAATALKDTGSMEEARGSRSTTPVDGRATAATTSSEAQAAAPKSNASPIGFVTSRVSVSEKSLAAVIQVKRLGNSTAGRLPIQWRTEKRSAQPGEDYGATVSGTLVLQDGQRMGAIYVPISNDELSESDEMFTVELVDTARAQATDIGLAIVTIRDDDRVLLTAAP